MTLGYLTYQGSNSLWTTGGVQIGTFSPLPQGFTPRTLVYDCAAGIMYLLVDDGFQHYQTAVVNLSDASLSSFQTVPLTSIDIFSLAFDSATAKTYAIVIDYAGGGNYFVYEVDLAANTWAPLSVANPTGQFLRSLVYDCGNNRLLGINFDGVTYTLYEVSTADGSWTSLGVTLSPSPSSWPFMAYDQSNGQIDVAAGSSPPKLFELNTATGALTVVIADLGSGLAPSGIAFAQPCCCLHEATCVTTANGRTVRISELRSGDAVLDWRGRATPVLQNAYLGQSKDFIRIASGSLGNSSPSADLLIREGHPLLLAGQEVSCEQLLGWPGVERQQLPESVGVYTLLTPERTFVRMDGCLVATWSEASFEQTNSGRFVRYM